ncbi:MAG: hypothetical protein ACRDLB_14845 [Actinomycetota bacterium]
MPEPGPYGPLPWSHPRPWSLWAYATLNLVLAVYFTIFIAEGDIDVPAWAFGVVLLYLAWRGSKLAWAASVTSVAIYLIVSAVEVSMATRQGGHHPMLHVMEATLLLAMLVLLLSRPTRRFYDLGLRRQDGVASQPR